MNGPNNPDGQVGTEFLFENEHVKVWNLDLQPGQSSQWHHHDYWYVTIVTVPGTLKAEFTDGTSSTETLPVGTVHFRDKDSVHRVTNVGESRYVNVIIELKQSR